MTGKRADLLVEIGTEELPPKALKSLMQAFADGVADALASAHLEHDGHVAYASPRRLAVRVRGLAAQQADRDVEQKGPPVRIAFDDAGQPTRAAQAFADKCGVAVAELAREETDKGEWLVYRGTEPGRPAAEIVPGCVQAALDALPIPRRMRWGAHAAEFVRPVHWVVMLHGPDVIEAEILGIASGRTTRGHRFIGERDIELADPDEYLEALESRGRVLADFEARRERISKAVEAAAVDAGGKALATDELYDEVCALTEWPVAVTGHFDERFLSLPREVIIATLTGHQRYFPVAREDGLLLPRFITVANLDSPEPDKVRDGNERVIRPRLADAAFFWESDRRLSLADRQSALADVVYQRGLGSLADKAQRTALIAARIAAATGSDPLQAERAAQLAKCDLLTGMVGEFPELQGTMGHYYAHADREPQAVAQAIGEHYRPRFAGDELPASDTGRVLALADRIDTLCGIFAAGKKPSGNRDPFGLRRAALGVIRIIIECRLELDLDELLAAAVDLQPVGGKGDVAADVREFIIERLRGWYLERDGLTAEMFDAVRARQPVSLTDFDARLAAVAAFVSNESAESLAAANKRIANILRQAEDVSADDGADAALFTEDAERSLHAALRKARDMTANALAARRYSEVLAGLAQLREPVDRFFDDVMVMAEDDAVRVNRLRLLAELRNEFLKVADISRLSIARS